MGMAHMAPMDTYNRKFYIAEHAVDRLRERWSKSDQHRHRLNEDLGNLIDAALMSSVSACRVRKLYDSVTCEDFRLADLSKELDDDLFAILKPNATKKRNVPHEAVVTLVTGRMVDQSLAGHSWRDPSTSPMAALQNFKIEPKPVAVIASTPTGGKTKLVDDAVMLTWFDTSENCSEIVSEANYKDRLATLLDTDLVSNVRAWRPIKFKSRVVVDVEE